LTAVRSAVRGLQPRLGACLALAVALTASAINVANAAPTSDLEGLIEAAVARLDPAAKTDVTPPASPPAPPVVFLNPVPGRAVDSPFGLRRLPWELHGRLHAGVDIAGPRGTPIVAACDGVVTRAGTNAGYGNFVEVAHEGGLTTLYGHLGKAAATAIPGAALKAGDTLGFMGSTGSSTGPHLHFEVRNGETPLNPVLFMGKTFAALTDLPIAAAAVVPPGVRLATVSYIPPSKLALARARGLIRVKG
jgi:murein DD-endopeptidase MepM/ murein hydrolase activator NlpD